MVTGQLLCHVDGLKEKVEELLAFLLHFGVRAFHLGDEVAQGQLSVEDPTVLTLLDGDVVQDLCLLEAGRTHFKDFFLDVELVIELLFCEVLLQLCFKNQIENTFLGLNFWNF